MNGSKPHIWSLYTNFRFTSKKITSKKDYSFYNTFLLKKPHSFYEPQLIQLQHSQEPYSFYKFSSKHVSGWCQKKICTPPIRDTQGLLSRSTWEANFCIFLYISVRKFLFQRRRKLLSAGGLNNFLKVAYFLSLVKCFKVFHFN